MSDVYGTFQSSEDVRAGLISHLSLWLPGYLAEVGRQRSVPLPGVRSYTVVITRDQLGTDSGTEYPLIVVSFASLPDGPEKRGDIALGTWDVTVGCAVAGVTMDEAAASVALYGSALRLLFVQHPGVTGVGRISIGPEMYEEIAWNDTLSICAVSFPVKITSDRVISKCRGGPALPPADPSVEDTVTTVSEINVDVVDVDRTEDL